MHIIAFARMRARKLPYTLVALCVLAIAHAALQHYGWSTPFLRSYLDDVLIVPIIGTAALWMQRTWIVNDDSFCYGKWSVVALCVYFGVAFEFIIPHFYTQYTADVSDWIAYAAGGVFFYIFINTQTAIACDSNR